MITNSFRNLTMASLCFAMIAALSTSCGAPADEDEDEEKYVAAPVVGGAAGTGGMPNDSELGSTVEATEAETTQSTKTIAAVVGSLALNLGGSGSSLALSGDDCEGFFCVAEAFGTIFDIVAESADCIIDRLTKDEDGNPVEFQQAGKVFFIDGFGLIPFGDEGAINCVDKKKIMDWARHNKLIEGDVGTAPSADEFYPPARFIVRKQDDGTFKWKIVFFPADFIDKLIVRVPAIAPLAGLDLDFEVFAGSHLEGETEGTGVGSMAINWDEFARMVKEIDKAFGTSDDDDSTPEGEVSITYDMASTPNKVTLKFHEGFSFGDDGDTFYAHDYENTVYLRGDERHLTFKMGFDFGKPEEEGEDGQSVGICQIAGKDSPMIAYSHIAEADYLSTPAQSFFQLRWKEASDGTLPKDWDIRIFNKEGGAFIWGDVAFDLWRKSDSMILATAFDLPVCAATQATVSTLATAINSMFGVEALVPNDDGTRVSEYLDLYKTGQDGVNPFITKAAADAEKPTFTYFQNMADPTAEGATPVIAE